VPSKNRVSRYVVTAGCQALPGSKELAIRLDYLAKCRIRPSQSVDLGAINSGDTAGFADKRAARATHEKNLNELTSIQDVLSAYAGFGLLVIFQGMDTAGKDGAIKHVMSGVNPQGVSVHSFKEPSAEERRHDYLWRCAKVVPERGRIGIFNRSYYEDVIVTRVHPELLRAADPHAPKPDKAFWHDRFTDINNFERYLVRNDIHIVKFYLHISKEEQRVRLLARLENPRKQWKFSESDVAQRAFWKDYHRAYADMLGETSTQWAPWYVIPSDHKWFTRVAVAGIIVDRLKTLRLRYPRLSKALKVKLRKLGALLRRE
jgi:PPK2 family polyphosphate:nucleotide phosphotransferase